MTKAKQLASALRSPFTGAFLILSSRRAFMLAAAMGVMSGGLLAALLVVALVVNTPLTDWVTDRTGFWYALIWLGVLVAQLPMVLATHRAGSAVLTGRLQEALSQHVESGIDPNRIFVPRDASLWTSIKGFLVALPKALLLTVVLLGVNFIPLAGPFLAIGLAILMSARELARDLVTLPMERRGLGDAQIDQELKDRWVLWNLSGVLFTGLSMVPFVNFVAIPAAVAAAATRYSELEKSLGSPGSADAAIADALHAGAAQASVVKGGQLPVQETGAHRDPPQIGTTQ